MSSAAGLSHVLQVLTPAAALGGSLPVAGPSLSVKKNMRLLIYLDWPQPPPLFNPVFIGTGSALVSRVLAVNLFL